MLYISKTKINTKSYAKVVNIQTNKGVRHFLKIENLRIINQEKEGETLKIALVYAYLEFTCKFKIKVCIKVY